MTQTSSARETLTGANMRSKPLIAVTIGDPAGIGPEIVLKSMLAEESFAACDPIIIGEPAFLRRVARDLSIPVEIREVTDLAAAQPQRGVAVVYPVVGSEPLAVEPGKVQAAAGRAAYSYIVRSIELGLAGQVAGVATAPINKPAIHAAGIDFIGHTEMYGEMTATPAPLTMFVTGPLKVFFLTRHMSLRQAINALSEDLILATLDRMVEDLAALGYAQPHIAVAALNPHAGDEGMFGDEEIRIIEPAIKRAQARGLRISGPVPADSVFARAYRGAYDAVLSLYHDQGHIATKTLDPEHTISVTTGLPFIRTSVDHGTAFDIAGKGVANEVSMIEAIRIAADLSQRVLAHRNRLS